MRMPNRIPRKRLPRWSTKIDLVSMSIVSEMSVSGYKKGDRDTMELYEYLSMLCLCTGHGAGKVFSFPSYHPGHHFNLHGREFCRLSFFKFQMQVQVSEKVQAKLKDEFTSYDYFQTSKPRHVLDPEHNQLIVRFVASS